MKTIYWIIFGVIIMTFFLSLNIEERVVKYFVWVLCMVLFLLFFKYFKDDKPELTQRTGADSK